MVKKWMLGALLAGYVALVVLARLRKNGAHAVRGGWPANLAHRGASADAPENTLEAFRLGMEAGAGGLEMDVHMTRDGHVVVIHDDTVDRTTDGTGAVREMTLGGLRSLDAGYRFSPDGGLSHPYRGRGLRIPTLAEVYAEFPDASINVEIKERQPGAEEAVLRVIDEARARGRTIVASGRRGVVERFRRVSGGGVPTAASRREIRNFLLLSRLGLERLIQPSYVALQVPESHAGIRIVTRRFMRAAAERGVRVDVWTINDPSAMRRLLDLGAGVIMTDRPAELAEILEGRASG